MAKKTKKEMEHIIFDAFIQIKPNFAGEPVTCVQCEKEPPDFICEDEIRKIGVELGQWLHKEQTEIYRALEYTEKEIKEKVLYDATILDYLKNHDISIYRIGNKYPSKINRANFIFSLIDFINKFIIGSMLTREEYFLYE